MELIGCGVCGRGDKKISKDKVSNKKVTKVEADGAKAPEVGEKVVNPLTEDLTPDSEGTITVMHIPVRAKNVNEFNLWKSAYAYANVIVPDLKFTDNKLMLVRLEFRRIVPEVKD